MPDTWLAELFGRPVYRVALTDEFIGGLAAGRDDERTAWQALRKGEVFAYAKVSPTAPLHLAFLEDEGFRLVDTNVVFDRPVNNGAAPVSGQCTVRFAVPGDEEQTVEVARRAFRYSRFHLDPNVSAGVADTIKAEWVRNYFRGSRGDAMVVAEAEGEIAGFVQLLTTRNRTLVIDLIAVDERHRRKQIAAAMIDFAAANVPDVDNYVVGTQIANVPSMRLYEKMGFRVAGATYVLHFHGSAQ